MYKYKVNEGNTCLLSFQLVDENAANIELTDLDSLTLTLYYYNDDLTTGDKYHLNIVNSRTSQNVLNTNDVTVSATGLVQWVMQDEDNAKLNSNTELEIHVALFTWVWNTDNKNNLEVLFEVKKVPYSV